MHLHAYQHSTYYRRKASEPKLVRRETGDANGTDLVKPILIAFIVIFSLLFAAWAISKLNRMRKARKHKARGQGEILRMGSLRKNNGAPRAPVGPQQRPAPMYRNIYEATSAAQYAGMPAMPERSHERQTKRPGYNEYPSQGRVPVRHEWV